MKGQRTVSTDSRCLIVMYHYVRPLPARLQLVERLTEGLERRASPRPYYAPRLCSREL